jgi:arsenate reductase-like glutaredoxin family protein
MTSPLDELKQLVTSMEPHIESLIAQRDEAVANLGGTDADVKDVTGKVRSLLERVTQALR